MADAREVASGFKRAGREENRSVLTQHPHDWLQVKSVADQMDQVSGDRFLIYINSVTRRDDTRDALGGDYDETVQYIVDEVLYVNCRVQRRVWLLYMYQSHL